RGVAAPAEEIAGAYVAARDADALSAFGGIVGLNRPIDERTAAALTATFIEAVVAPDIEDAARPILAKKQNMRVVVPMKIITDGFRFENDPWRGGVEIRTKAVGDDLHGYD